MLLNYKMYTIFYDFSNKCFLHYYCFNITEKVKKGFGFLFLLYLVSFFVETSFCDYNVEYQEKDQNLPYTQSSTQKKYTLSELTSDELPRSEEGERFTSQQKKLLICAAVLTVSVVALFLMMNAEIHDLEKRVQDLEKLAKAQGSSSTQEWKKPKGWQFGFGF